MLSVERRRWLVPLLLGGLAFVLDQISKVWILNNLGPIPMARRIAVVGDWLNIVYHENTGVAFGLFQNMSPLFIVVSSLICVGAIYVYIYHLPNENWSVQISMGLIIGGALGNVADRIRLGYVVDFIQVGWFPIFNVADSAITTGATLLALQLLFMPEEEPAPPDPQDEALLADLLQRDVGPPLEHDQHNSRQP